MKVSLKVICQSKKINIECVAMNSPCLLEIKIHVISCISGAIPVISLSVECA